MLLLCPFFQVPASDNHSGEIVKRFRGVPEGEGDQAPEPPGRVVHEVQMTGFQGRIALIDQLGGDFRNLVLYFFQDGIGAGTVSHDHHRGTVDFNQFPDRFHEPAAVNHRPVKYVQITINNRQTALSTAWINRQYFH